jgi:hypothetical protein
MLQEELATPSRHCFLNTSTGQCVQVDIPELRDHELLALTPEGLLVLAHKPTCGTTLCMFNPLTRHLMHLPPLSKLLPSGYQDLLPESDDLLLGQNFVAWGSGIANDNSTVVFCLSMLNTIGMTKPGDDHWTLLHCDGSDMTAPIMFEGRLYYVANNDAIMVLEMSTPRLEVAAKLNMRVSPMADSLHLFNNSGELMLVHRRFRRCRRRPGANNYLETCYDVYRVDLDTRTLLPVKSLGGRAVFMGMWCSLLVSPNVFPSGSVSNDTIYLSCCVDIQASAYHLVDGSRDEGTGWRYKDSWVPRPHTLADSLSLSVTI